MPQPLRKRLKRREVIGGVRYITFSCHRRSPLLGNPSIRDVFVRALYAARARFRFELYAWVVMPEHVHLMLRPPEGLALDAILKALKQSVAQTVIARWKQLNATVLDSITVHGRIRFWQRGGGFDRNVRDQSELAREIRYIHRNPIERGLVQSPEDWVWSSLRWWMGIGSDDQPCDTPPGDPRSWAAWKGFV